MPTRTGQHCRTDLFAARSKSLDGLDFVFPLDVQLTLGIMLGLHTKSQSQNGWKIFRALWIPVLLSQGLSAATAS